MLFILSCYFSMQGSENAKVIQGGHNTCAMFGRGRDYHRNDAERLARMLVLRHILDENIVIGHHDNAICYVKLGSKAVAFLQGHIKVGFRAGCSETWLQFRAMYFLDKDTQAT